MTKFTAIAVFSLAAAALLIAAYAAWYSNHRQSIIAENARCRTTLERPAPPSTLRGPDGTLMQVTLVQPCLLQAVPPTLREILQGDLRYTDIPPGTEIKPYTLWDVLSGKNVIGPPSLPACDQSATTTDCSKLASLPQSAPQPYVPPNPVQPSETWTSATGTPISLYGFSFELPAGWHGSVYKEAYGGDTHALVQRNVNDRGFTIDCPPVGKGLEAATRLSSEERSFSTGGQDYAIAFEKWTAPGNDPWYFLWVRRAQDPSGTYCLAQGTAAPEIEQAMRTMYTSWSAAQ